jgi:hypothetical protein
VIGECQRPQNHQHNSGYRDWFHIFDHKVRKLSFGPE